IGIVVNPCQLGNVIEAVVWKELTCSEVHCPVQHVQEIAVSVHLLGLNWDPWLNFRVLEHGGASSRRLGLLGPVRRCQTYRFVGAAGRFGVDGPDTVLTPPPSGARGVSLPMSPRPVQQL